MFDNPLIFLVLISILTVVAEWIGKRRRKRAAEDEVEAEAVPEVDRSPDRTEPEAEPAPNWRQQVMEMLGEQVSSAPPPAPRLVPVEEPEEVPRIPEVVEVPPPLPTSPPSAALLAHRPRSGWAVRFRTRSRVRDAIVVAVVLGNPKASEEDPDLLRL